MTNPLHLDVPAGVPWIDFTREFDAPVAAVFDAHRDPAKVVRWLGPRGYEMVAERWDFVSGGGYRYVHRDPAGNEYWFRGASTRCGRTSSHSRPSSSRACRTRSRSSS